jgi:hypothetical protein
LGGLDDFTRLTDIRSSNQFIYPNRGSDNYSIKLPGDERIAMALKTPQEQQKSNRITGAGIK